MYLVVGLASVAGFLLVALAGVALARRHAATQIVYGASLALSMLVLAASLAALLTRAPPASLVLPLGLPWIGTHFRLDALAAFFVIVVSLGSSTASLYALGYGRHEDAPRRVSLFLAGMTLVALAGDALSFLLCWEVMSVACSVLISERARARTTHQFGGQRVALSGKETSNGQHVIFPCMHARCVTWRWPNGVESPSEVDWPKDLARIMVQDSRSGRSKSDGSR